MDTTAPLTSVGARRSLAATIIAVLLSGLSLLSPSTAQAASSTTGDLTVCAYGSVTRNVPIQLFIHNGSGWQLLRNGTTGTGCGTWRDVPANRWLYVAVKTTTYGSYDTCAWWPGSWYQIYGNTSSFYVSPWQAARVNLQVQRYNFC